MTNSAQEEFVRKVIKIVDRWSFEQCAYCKDGTMISIEGMLDFRCSKCGKTMNPLSYLGEIAEVVYSYREQNQSLNNTKQE